MNSVSARLFGGHSLHAASALMLVWAATLGGCAFGTRNATLRYPPAAQPNAATAPDAVTAPAPSKGEIAVTPFADMRGDKTQVGSVRNGFGMPTAKVVTSDNVPGWVNDAIRKELTSAGYRVVDKTSDSPTALSLSGEITSVWCDAYFVYNGEIGLTVRLRRGRDELLARSYEGYGGAGVSWAATAEAYVQTLSIALADALKKLLVDIDRATLR